MPWVHGGRRWGTECGSWSQPEITSTRHIPVPDCGHCSPGPADSLELGIDQPSAAPFPADPGRAFPWPGSELPAPGPADSQHLPYFTGQAAGGVPGPGSRQQLPAWGRGAESLEKPAVSWAENRRNQGSCMWGRWRCGACPEPGRPPAERLGALTPLIQASPGWPGVHTHPEPGTPPAGHSVPDVLHPQYPAWALRFEFRPHPD